MQLFQPSVVQVKPSSFNPEAYQQIYQLSLTTDLSSILQTVKHVNQHVYYIFGEPGSGCTTLVQGICQHVCLQPDTFITESDVLYLSLNQLCSEELFYGFIIKLIYQRNGTVLFKGKWTSEENEEKKQIMGEFLHENFKVICIDNAVMCSGFIDDFLADVLKACKIPCFVVFNQMKQDALHSGDFTSVIAVKGLNHSDAKSLACKELQPLTLTEDQISKLCDLVHYNPAAIQLVCGLINGCSRTDDLVSVLQNVSSSSSSVSSSCSMDIVVELISNVFQHANIDMLESLSCLHRPLPMLEISPAIKELIETKLLSVDQEGDVNWVSLHSASLMKNFWEQKKMTSSDGGTGLDILGHLLSLVSITLQRLVDEAENNAWPFVPERWQYINNVSEKENYNIKELLTSANAKVPVLTECEVLQECLYHAYIQGEYKKLAAILFVLDRYLYWSGDTGTTMEIINFLQSNSPDTAIAPQMVIRKARFMKNEGNVRGAESTLDSLLQSRTKIGSWQYKEDHEHMLVCGVCVQIKGEIQYRLGHWQQAASLLVLSIQYFSSLPQPDKKGLASSYGLLSQCLRNMTMNQYYQLVEAHGLLQCHPLLAAYFSGLEASKLSVYTPMFFLRHLCQAGENMLEFAKLTTNQHEKQLYLQVAIEDLKDSIQAHQTYKSLASREQFYVLVCACYKVSLALMQLYSTNEQTRGKSLKKLSLKLYEHYSCSNTRVSVDEKVSRLVDKCLEILQLEKYSSEDLPNAGQILLDYYTKRSAKRLQDQTSLASVELFAKPLSSLPTGFDTTKNITVQQSQGSAQMGQPNKSSEEVDRCAETVEIDDGKKSVSEEVDRCAETVEIDDGKKSGFEEVDRSAVTIDLDDKAKSATSGVQKRISIEVDRYADTKDPEGEKSSTGMEEQNDNLPEVNRSAETKDLPDSTDKSKTIDDFALLVGTAEISQLDSSVIVQSLEDEAVSLPSQTHQIPSGDEDEEAVTSQEQGKQARDAIAWKYDFASREWRCQPTIGFIGDCLQLGSKKGNQRDVYHVEFINQDEPLAKYVAKSYRKEKDIQQYTNDVLSQMTARHYVTLFNQCLFKSGAVGVREIQFLPVILLQLVDSSGHVTQVFNAEPYMSGEFTKLTNNVAWKLDNKERTDLVLAYSHFTYQASDGKLIIVDIQGWAPQDGKGCTYLTDPQIHSSVYKCFGTGNWQQKDPLGPLWPVIGIIIEVILLVIIIVLAEKFKKSKSESTKTDGRVEFSYSSTDDNPDKGQVRLRPSAAAPGSSGEKA